jgi:hypothetical protein
MQIARPPDGFKIIVQPLVQAYIDEEIKENFRLRQYWLDILERVRFAALTEGRSIPGNPPHFTFVAMGAVDFKLPTVQLMYSILGDTLTVEAAVVWTEDDYESDAMGL